MRADGVVVVAPDGELPPSISEARKDFLVQQLVAQTPVEAFDEGVLGRLAGRDVVPGDAALVLPFEDGVTGQLAAVVADDRRGLAVQPDQGIELAHDAAPGERGVGDQREILAGAIVDDSEYAKAPPRLEDVREEVQGPALVGKRGHSERGSGARGPLAPAPAFHRQAFFLVQASQLLVVHGDSLTCEHEPDAAIAEAPALSRDLAHAPSDLRIVRRALCPHRLRIDADQAAGATLRDVVAGHRPQRRAPPLLGRRQRFPSRSFSTELSTMASASSRFRRAFSVSRLFSLRASETSRPPYLAFHL